MEKSLIEIYCDGACFPNPGKMGIGIVLKYKNHTKEISRAVGKGTNNVAELVAIKESLKLLKTTDIPVKIYSDSMYAINQSSGKWNPTKNIALINSIKNNLKKLADFELIWIKAHNGDRWNEKADYLAKKGIR